MTGESAGTSAPVREPDPAPAPPGPGGGPALLQPFRNRNFALLFAGQLCSLAGDQLYVVALPFLILQHSGVRELGLVLACFGLARIVTVPLGGLLADRVDRVRLMLCTDAGRASCVLAVAALAFGGGHSILAVMALTAVLGACEGLFLPASYAVLPDVLPQEQLPAGNALNSMLEGAAAFVAPALAGLVVAFFSPGVALAIDALTFVVSAVTLLAVRLSRTRPVTDPVEADAEIGSSRRDFTGLLGRNRVVQLVLLITLLSNLGFDAMADVALPVFSRDDLARGSQGFGLMLSAFGAGTVVGALLTDALFRVPRRGLVALGLGVLQGAALVVVPRFGGLAGACALLATSGLTMGLLNSFYMTHLQQRVPDHLLGRTMAALTLAAFGAQPVSVLVAGQVLPGTGPAPVFAAAGGLIAAGYLIVLFSPEFRTL
jgi:MFS family permease